MADAPRTPESLAAEFDALLARAGIALPSERRDAALATYPEFRAQIDLLHTPRAHTAEPSNTYKLWPRSVRA